MAFLSLFAATEARGKHREGDDVKRGCPAGFMPKTLRLYDTPSLPVKQLGFSTLLLSTAQARNSLSR